MSDLVPSPTDLSAEGTPLPPGDAFVMLSKPTLDLQFEDMKLIAEDLRAKRVRFLQGKADKPPKERAPQLTEEEKRLRGQHVAGLLGQLKL